MLAADGRRMSKSLGTGVDPLELIAEYGADATRFGLAYMSSVQDVRFSAERIEMGRNFANKIWNASRLVLQGAASARPSRAVDAGHAGRPLDLQPPGGGHATRWPASTRRYEFDDVGPGALPLRLERDLRLVPGDGQGPPLQRGRRPSGCR